MATPLERRIEALESALRPGSRLVVFVTKYGAEHARPSAEICGQSFAPADDESTAQFVERLQAIALRQPGSHPAIVLVSGLRATQALQ